MTESPSTSSRPTLGRRRRAIEAAAQRANDNAFVRLGARAGFVVIGLIHIAIGVVAIAIAFGANLHADQRDLFVSLVASPVGAAILLIAALCLLGLGVWQWTAAAWTDAPRIPILVARRFTAIGKALGFAAVGWSALAVVVQQGRGQTANEALAAAIPDAVIRTVLLSAVAMVIGSVGVSHIVIAFTRRFRQDLAVSAGTPASTVVVVLGSVGHFAKGATLLLVAISVVAGIVLTQQATLPSGFDDALRSLAGAIGGPILLGMLGAGLVVYGLFFIARAVLLRRPTVGDVFGELI